MSHLTANLVQICLVIIGNIKARKISRARKTLGGINFSNQYYNIQLTDKSFAYPSPALLLLPIEVNRIINQARNNRKFIQLPGHSSHKKGIYVIENKYYLF